MIYAFQLTVPLDAGTADQTRWPTSTILGLMVDYRLTMIVSLLLKPRRTHTEGLMLYYTLKTTFILS